MLLVTRVLRIDIHLLVEARTRHYCEWRILKGFGGKRNMDMMSITIVCSWFVPISTKCLSIAI